MGARDARYQFHGQEANAAFGQYAGGVDGSEGFAEADDGLAAAEQCQIGRAGFGIGAGAADLQNHFGGLEHRFPAGDDTHAFFGVLGIGVTRAGAGAGFHQQFHAGLIQNRERPGNHGHPAFAGECFGDDAYRHLPLRGLPVPVYTRSEVLKKKRSSASAVSGASEP